MPEGVLDAVVVQEAVVDTLALPYNTLDGVIKTLRVRVAGGSVAQGGLAVPKSSLWSDEDGVTVTFLVQFHLVVTPVGVRYCPEGVLEDAGNHVERDRCVVRLPLAHGVKALVIHGVPRLAELFSHHHHHSVCSPAGTGLMMLACCLLLAEPSPRSPSVSVQTLVCGRRGGWRWVPGGCGEARPPSPVVDSWCC